MSRSAVRLRTCAFAWFSGTLQCHRKGWPGQELLIWGGPPGSQMRELGVRGERCAGLPLWPATPGPLQWHDLTEITSVSQVCTINQINASSLFQEQIKYGEKKTAPGTAPERAQDSAD